MPRQSWVQVSLARKISLLFGTAVLLTIAATLAFPWLQMTALNEQSLLWQAKLLAATAFQTVDLRESDWTGLQTQLDLRWPVLARGLGLPDRQAPRLVAVGSQGPGFQREAIERLSQNPEQRYYWRVQSEAGRCRFALAVRGSEADAHPDALLGIIDVQIPIPRGSDLWNVVITVLAGASGAVLAIIVFYVVTQRLVLTPVARLRLAAEQVTTGDAGVRAAIATGDELQDLSEAFNNMLDRLRSAQEEQQRINRSLDVKLGELAETNVALYESNRLKSEFLTNVSHELRTPLVSIIGFAELLRDASGNSEIDAHRLARYVHNILTSGRSLLEIINDLLDLAKIEAGRMELHLSDFSVAELCRDMVDFIRPLADKRNQVVETRVAEGLPLLHGDSGKLKQILYNLLSNAVKFTPPGGIIRLDADPTDNGRIRVAVTDTGPGIAPDQHAAIFEKFHQVDASRTREHQGTGLGLAITRELVHVLGGAIRVESELGKGAAFIVTLPLRTEGAAPRSLVRLT